MAQTKKKICPENKSIFAVLLFLLAAAAGFFLLPNWHRISNRLYDREAFTISGEEITCVSLENVSEGKNGTVTGCYLPCGCRMVHDLQIFTDQELACGRIRVYYILRQDQSYCEDQSFETALQACQEGYRVILDRRAFGIRLDLTTQQGEAVVLTGAAGNQRDWTLAWGNVLPWALAALIWALFRKNASDRTRRRVPEEKDLFSMDRKTAVKKMLALSANDRKARYAGAALGRGWAYAQPFLTILVMWYVFQIGLRSAPVRQVPFLIWFLAAYVPWMYFNDGLMGMAGAVLDYQYLVKKICFPVSLLPGIRLLSAAAVHLFFSAVLFLALVLYGCRPELVWLQILYYSVALTVLLYALGLFFASLTVLLRDMLQVLAVALQILFWYTPIVWNEQDLQEGIRWAFHINPLFYVVNGYRETFFSHMWVWEHPQQNVWFWSVTLLLLLAGESVFRRSRQHFADLL